MKHSSSTGHKVQLFVMISRDIMKSNGFKLELRKCGLSIRRGFRASRMVRQHNRLLGKAAVAVHSCPVCFADPCGAEVICFYSSKRGCRAVLWDLLCWKYQQTIHPSIKDDVELVKPVLTP